MVTLMYAALSLLGKMSGGPPRSASLKAFCVLDNGLPFTLVPLDASVAPC